MDGTVWDAARIGRTAGVELTATFHPDRITTRMRNSIKRMVMSGQMKGGWNSHAKRLARALCDKYGVPYNQSSAYNVFVPAGAPEYLRFQLLDLLKADEAAMRLEEGGRLHHYYSAKYDRDRDALQCEAASHSVRFNDKDIGTAASNLLTDFVQQSGSDKRIELCKLLDGTEPIVLSVPSY